MESRPPATRRAKLAAAAVAAVFLSLFAWQTWRTLSTRPEIVAARPRDPAEAFGIDRANVAAPPIDLVALDGSRFDLAAARGQVVFVNFWATWCPPCVEEMPSMVRLGQDLAQRYPGRFKMVAVSVDEGPDPVKKFFASPPFSGPPSGLTVALDQDQTVTRAYYCTARGGRCPDLKFPETYIVDRTGTLVAYVVGPRNWADPSARVFLERLIAP
jgi:thiol-disulfide isomerase/thioredoxin